MTHPLLVDGRPTRRLVLGVASVGLVMAGFSASIAAWRAERSHEAQERADRIAVVASTATTRLGDALARQREGVLDVAALFATTDRVGRAEFAAFVNRALPLGPSRAAGVGFTQWVTDDDLEAFVAAARADGAPGFTLQPSFDRPEHAIVLYNEPAGRLGTTWGRDALDDDALQPALERSRDSGAPVLSAATVLDEDRDTPADERPAAFVLYTPLYRDHDDPGTVAGRWAELRGWISVTFRATDLLAGLAGELPARLTFSREAEARPVAAVGGPAAGAGSTVELDVHGERWILEVEPTTALSSVGATPGFVLAAGLLATLLLGGLLLTLHGTSRRAQRAASDATRSLSASEARLRATLAGAPDLILVVDADGTIVSASDQSRRILGYRPEAMVGRPVEMLLPDALREAHAGHRARFLAHPRSRPMGEDLELAARAADGSLVPVEISLSPLRSGAGRDSRLQVIVVIRDVSARKRAEADQRLLSAIVASTHDAILTQDVDGVITSWNGAAERLYGWTAAEAVGRHISLVVPEHHRPGLDEILARLRAGETLRQHETDRLRRDGALVPVSLTVSPMRDAAGRVIGASSIGRDISGPKADREALETYAADLERSNHDLEEFAYIASHDLSEPLRVVGGYVDLLQARYGEGRVLDADATRYMATVAEGVDRMRLLIEDLLAFARLRAESQHVGLVDMAEVVRAALANLDAAVTEAGSTVRIDPLPVVWGDGAQIAQLVQNLLANAVKFRDPTRPSVVAVRAGPRRGRWAISVSDNGIGIDPEYHERIFAMFRRVHGRDRYDGTGIGLALCRRVVDLHGGEISVASTPGEGATFTFTLPPAPDLNPVGEAPVGSTA